MKNYGTNLPPDMKAELSKTLKEKGVPLTAALVETINTTVSKILDQIAGKSFLCDICRDYHLKCIDIKTFPGPKNSKTSILDRHPNLYKKIKKTLRDLGESPEPQLLQMIEAAAKEKLVVLKSDEFLLPLVKAMHQSRLEYLLTAQQENTKNSEETKCLE